MKNEDEDEIIPLVDKHIHSLTGGDWYLDIVDQTLRPINPNTGIPLDSVKYVYTSGPCECNGANPFCDGHKKHEIVLINN